MNLSWTLFFSIWGTLQYTGTPNWEKKCSTGQRFIRNEVTSYKIHILVDSKYISSLLRNYQSVDGMKIRCNFINTWTTKRLPWKLNSACVIAVHIKTFITRKHESMKWSDLSFPYFILAYVSFITLVKKYFHPHKNEQKYCPYQGRQNLKRCFRHILIKMNKIIVRIKKKLIRTLVLIYYLCTMQTIFAIISWRKKKKKSFWDLPPLINFSKRLFYIFVAFSE